MLRALNGDIKQEFRKKYRILSTESAKEGLSYLAELKKQGEAVALFLSDQRMPEMIGVEFLTKAREIFPDARRLLLTANSDSDTAVRAINEVQPDYFLMKP